MSMTTKMRDQVAKEALISMLQTLAQEEDANGSEQLRRKITKFVEEWQAGEIDPSPGDVGAFIYELYTDYIDEKFVLKEEDEGDE